MRTYDASFRGIAFNAERASRQCGRSVVITELPFQNKPVLQDMGGCADRGRFAAFVWGEDYLLKAERLTKAFNRPGAGDLVLPWLGGSVRARILGPVDIHYSADEGGLARFDCEYVIEWAYGDYFTDANSRAILAQTVVLDGAVKAQASKFSLKGLVGHALEATTALQEKVAEVTSRVQTVMDGVQREFLAPLAAADRALTQAINSANPLRFFNAVGGVFSQLSQTGVGSLAAVGALAGSMSRQQSQGVPRVVAAATFQRNVRAVLAAAHIERPKPSPYQTAQNNQLAQNADVIAVVLGAHAVSCACSLIAAADFSRCLNYQEASALGTLISDEIDRLLPMADYELLQALLELKRAAQTDIDTRSRQLSRLSHIELFQPQTALNVAYQHFGAGEALEAADEFLQLNAVHPLFVPAGKWKVLSRD